MSKFMLHLQAPKDELKGSHAGMNPKLFFLLLFCFQILVIFQGIELADTGFYGSFYQQLYVLVIGNYRWNISEDFPFCRLVWLAYFMGFRVSGNHRSCLPLFKEIRTYRIPPMESLYPYVTPQQRPKRILL